MGHQPAETRRRSLVLSSSSKCLFSGKCNPTPVMYLLWWRRLSRSFYCTRRLAGRHPGWNHAWGRVSGFIQHGHLNSNPPGQAKRHTRMWSAQQPNRIILPPASLHSPHIRIVSFPIFVPSKRFPASEEPTTFACRAPTNMLVGSRLHHHRGIRQKTENAQREGYASRGG